MIRKIKRLDYIIFIILACLTVVSTLMIYSATSNTAYEGMYRSNLILIGVFCIPLMMVAFIDYRIITRFFSHGLYALGIGLLVFTMYYGVDIYNSKRWVMIAGVQFQPSELVKIFVIILLAHLFSKREGENLRLIKDVIPVGILTLIPVYFVLKQPDLGTSLVFFGILLGMLWMSNIRMTHMVVFLFILASVISLVIWLYYSDTDLLSKMIKPHQMARIQTFLEPTKDPDNSWHVLNSIMAVSTGELSGKGFLNGYFVQNGFIPVLYSDSIFVVIGEEYGFLGSASLLLLYFILIYRMILIAMEATDRSGRYIVIGIISMWVVQIFENIGMHIGLLPLTGIALPFISYGGSSLLTNMISIGLVLSVRLYQEPTASN